MSLHTGDIVEVTPHEVAQGGWCVARAEGQVVFVRHALPGERVRARITEVTTRFARADAVEILDASPDRVDAPCPAARPGGCGGCDWQHASLPAQRALKASVVEQQLRRLAGVDLKVTVEPLPGDENPGTERPAGSPPPAGESDNSNKRQPGFGWRTRVQFAVGGDGRAGLRGHRSHEIIDVGDCLIAHPGIRDLGIPALSWDGASSVEAVTGESERAVIVSRAGREQHSRGRQARGRQGRERHAQERRGQRGQKTGGAADAAGQPAETLAAHSVSPAADTAGRSEPKEAEGVTAVTSDAVLSRAGRRIMPLRGRPYLSQHAAGRDWRLSAGAFWQVHPAAADTLAAAVLSALEPEPGDTALDLYCGAGLFAGVLAPAVGPDGTVVGIESDEAAVRDARHNLRDTPWARVHRGDVAEVLRRGRPGPRSGTRSGAQSSARPGARRGAQPEARSASRPGAQSAAQPAAQPVALPLARLAVADPPRAGLDREVIRYLTASGVARFAYVSCDPATLARDIRLLLADGWRLDGLRAFDAFPMTHHVECLARLTR